MAKAKQYKPMPDNYTKKSGAKETIIKDGKSKGLIAINAWNSSKSKGFITAKAFQTHASTKSKGESGKRHVALIFEVLYRDTGNKLIIPASYCVDTGKAFLEDLNMVIATKAPNGGYFGRAN